MADDKIKSGHFTPNDFGCGINNVYCTFICHAWVQIPGMGDSSPKYFDPSPNKTMLPSPKDFDLSPQKTMLRAPIPVEQVFEAAKKIIE